MGRLAKNNVLDAGAAIAAFAVAATCSTWLLRRWFAAKLLADAYGKLGRVGKPPKVAKTPRTAAPRLTTQLLDSQICPERRWPLRSTAFSDRRPDGPRHAF